MGPSPCSGRPLRHPCLNVYVSQNKNSAFYVFLFAFFLLFSPFPVYLQLSRVPQLFTGISWLVSTMCRPLRDGMERSPAGGKKNRSIRNRTFSRTDKLCLLLSNKNDFSVCIHTSLHSTKKKEKKKRCCLMIYPLFARCVACATNLAAAADPLLLAGDWPRPLRPGQWALASWTWRSRAAPRCDSGGFCCGRPCPSSWTWLSS